jgi:HK97 family phage major capsid protein
VLFDALTIGGGDPAGQDGGFLVPEDVDNQIRELSRTLNPLAEFFAQETVGTNSGWRVMDAAPTVGMAAVDEAGAVLEGENPTFTKVPFTLAKYGMFLPVSKELAQDEIANLFGYLARWFARKEVITQNTLLLAALGTLSTTLIATGSELKGVKAALNKALDPMIAVNATLVTNQTGFDILDNLVDGTGRPLLDTDPKTGMPMMLKTRPIRTIADSVLANMSGKAPFFIGDFRQYATMFQRNALEVVSTDVGGSAFRTDSIEVRGIKRMSVSKFDTAAVVLRTMTPEA